MSWHENAFYLVYKVKISPIWHLPPPEFVKLNFDGIAVQVLLAWEAWFGIVKGNILFSFSDSVGILSINRSLKLLNWHSLISSVEYSSSFGGRRFYLCYMMGFGYVLSSLDYCRCGGLNVELM